VTDDAELCDNGAMDSKTPTEPPYDTDREALERDTEVEFVKGSGPGGQHRNKRETGVRLRHIPSGVVAMATERRSQARNRELAFERLAERLAELNEVPTERVETAPTRASRVRRLSEKRKLAQKKASRQHRPEPDAE
jgi:protein subunit release factor A